VSTFIQQLFQIGVYKRSQGRVARQVTFATLAITITLGLWRLSTTLKLAKWVGDLNDFGFYLWLPGLLLVAGLWIAYRTVNLPNFADFLIAVGAEMNKVSWPARAELVRASIVVIFVIFALAALLYAYDFIWLTLFKAIGVIRVSS
jgi:preprotein translocase subunit SecE